VTEAPTIPMLGLNPLIVGAPADAPTVNDAVLVPVPVGLVTLIVPVVAPVGTVTTSWVPLA